jgi:hypothetical protein
MGSRKKGLVQLPRRDRNFDGIMKKGDGCRPMLYKDNELKLWFYDCIKSIKK